METLDMINRTSNVLLLQWFKENYCRTNIAGKIKADLCDFLNLINFQYCDNIEKAISQDIKKMLLSAKIIFDYSENFQESPLFVENEDGYAELFFNEKRELLTINMEYYIFKLRVIFEYVSKIINHVVTIDIQKYKIDNGIANDKKISDIQRENIRLDYICKLLNNNGNIKLNLHWLNQIRNVRNQLVHEGASCIVFENEKEPLFQAYSLAVDDLLDLNDYLSNGNAISCSHFIVSTFALLIYFIDSLLKVLKLYNYDDNDSCCKLNYTLSNDKRNEFSIIDKIFGITSVIPIYQECLFNVLDRYIK